MSSSDSEPEEITTSKNEHISNFQKARNSVKLHELKLKQARKEKIQRNITQKQEKLQKKLSKQQLEEKEEEKEDEKMDKSEETKVPDSTDMDSSDLLPLDVLEKAIVHDEKKAKVKKIKKSLKKGTHTKLDIPSLKPERVIVKDGLTIVPLNKVSRNAVSNELKELRLRRSGSGTIPRVDSIFGIAQKLDGPSPVFKSQNRK
ncbi:hypothetical protein HK098_002262 [Nowakowskiella sp. JEL0407]|nr:hypothetical protein HK098_002262 [Nowakowskiella sp. JEL0407]